MAIYHFNVKVGTRSKMANAIANSAKRTAKKLIDPRSGDVFDFPKTKEVIHHQIFAPADAPAWAFSAQQLWLAVELSEKRRDSQLYREMHITIPIELSLEQSKKLASDFTQWLADTNGTAAEMTLIRDGMISGLGHIKPEEKIGFHMYIMESMRVIGPDGFGEKVVSQLIFKEKEVVLETKRRLHQERAKWAEIANKALEDAGFPQRIDHRTLAAQGIQREPLSWLSFEEKSAHRRGERTAKLTKLLDGHRHRSLTEEIDLLAKEARQLERLIRKKAREERNGRLRETAIGALTANVRTTGDHLQESARLSSADGYFDRVIEHAATRNREWRAKSRTRTTRFITSRVIPEIELILIKMRERAKLSARAEQRNFDLLLDGLAKEVASTASVLDEIHSLNGDERTPKIGQSIGYPTLKSALTELLVPLAEQLNTHLPHLLSRREQAIHDPAGWGEHASPLVNNAILGGAHSDTPDETSIEEELFQSEPQIRAPGHFAPFFIEDIPSQIPDLDEQERLVDEWVRGAIVRMGRQPDIVHSSGVYIGRVLERCEGAFVQALGFDGSYTIHRTPFPPEVGDLVTVEIRSGLSTINVRHRSGHRTGE